MDTNLRRQLSFPCEGHRLGASLDTGERSTGLLFVSGGTEIRSGAHGGLGRLAAQLSRSGYPCFRFERRGVGESEGEDPGFADSADDLGAAAAAFREAVPGLAQIIGLGHCDGATALALHRQRLDLSGMILLNPWLVEPSADLPPPAAVRQRYVERLKSVDGWKRLLSGSVDYGKLFRGLTSLLRRPPPGSLAERTARAMAGATLPLEIIVARHDATAIAFLEAWREPHFRALRERPSTQLTKADSRSHSFARGEEPELLAQLCLAAIGRIERN